MKNLTDFELRTISGGIVSKQDCIRRAVQGIAEVKNCIEEYNKCFSPAFETEVGFETQYITITRCSLAENECIANSIQKTYDFFLDNCKK